MTDHLAAYFLPALPLATRLVLRLGFEEGARQPPEAQSLVR